MNDQCGARCPDGPRGVVELFHVRFTPESGHVQCNSACPLWANSGHCLYSISSSARPDRGSGMERPNALAVLRLMYSSTFVACWTGRSVGLSPLRIRPV